MCIASLLYYFKSCLSFEHFVFMGEGKTAGKDRFCENQIFQTEFFQLQIL